MRMSRKGKIIIGILILAVTVGMGTYLYKNRDNIKQDFGIPAGVSETGLQQEISELDKSELSFTGIVKSTQSYDLFSRVTGRLIEQYVKDGQEIKKGDKIVLIDNRDEIKTTKKAWDDAVASISEIKAVSDEAVDDLKNKKELFDKKEIDVDTYNQAVNRVMAANKDLESVLEDCDSYKIKYEVAIKNSLVTAPIDGKIKNLRLFKRQEIKDTTKLCEIENPDIKYVEFTVDSRVAFDINIDEAMTVTAGDQSYSGNIIDISESFDKKGDFVVKTILNEPEDIVDGTQVVVRFGTDTYN